MPFQPINFAQVPVQDTQGDLVQKLIRNLTGIEQLAGFPQQREAQALANAFSKMRNEQEPQRFQSEQEQNEIAKALRQAQIQKTELEYDPQKKAEYLSQILQQLGSTGTNGTPGNDELAKIFLRKSLGLPEETPSEKNARELDLFKNKMALKPVKPVKTGEDLTPASITAHQKIISAVNNILPGIEELKTLDVPAYGFGWFSPEKKATYESKIATLTDAYITAKNLPKTNESIAMIRDTVFSRRPGESVTHYRKRLDEEINSLNSIKDRSSGLLKKSTHSGNEQPPAQNETDTFDVGTGEWE